MTVFNSTVILEYILEKYSEKFMNFFSLQNSIFPEIHQTIHSRKFEIHSTFLN